MGPERCSLQALPSNTVSITEMELLRHYAAGFGSKVRNYVFSHWPPSSPTPGVEFVNEPVSAASALVVDASASRAADQLRGASNTLYK
jgi:hypothetical protein